MKNLDRFYILDGVSQDASYPDNLSPEQAQRLAYLILPINKNLKSQRTTGWEYFLDV